MTLEVVNTEELERGVLTAYNKSSTPSEKRESTPVVVVEVEAISLPQFCLCFLVSFQLVYSHQGIYYPPSFLLTYLI